MATGSDLGYQMRLDPKHTNTDVIRRLSDNDVINDVDKLYRAKTVIQLSQTQGTGFKVKGKRVAGKEEKALELNLAQTRASVLSVKAESASPPVASLKRSARRLRGLMGGTPREHLPKFDESKKLFVNKASLKQETKLPNITVNDTIDKAYKGKSSEKHKTSASGKDVGSWSLSHVNPSVLEIDMSGFAPFGENGYFSTYGVKGHQAYTTADKLSTNTSSVQSAKYLKGHSNAKDKLNKTNVGLDYDVRTITSGLSRSNLLNELSRSKTLSEFSADTKMTKRTSETLIQKAASAKQKVPALPDNLNLTRSSTCLVMSDDSPRGVFSKRKRGQKGMASSKDSFGSKESLVTKSGKKTSKPLMKTTSTQTKGGDKDSFYSNHLNDTISVVKETSRMGDLHNQGGVIYSPACFDQNSSYNNTLNWLKSPMHMEKSLSQNTTPRIVKETIEEGTESTLSEDEPGQFQIEVSIGLNKKSD